MKYALIFSKDADGLVIGITQVAYKNFITDLKAKGFKADRWGYGSAEAARLAGNLFVGTLGTEALSEAEQQQEAADSQTETI